MNIFFQEIQKTNEALQFSIIFYMFFRRNMMTVFHYEGNLHHRHESNCSEDVNKHTSRAFVHPHSIISPPGSELMTLLSKLMNTIITLEAHYSVFYRCWILCLSNLYFSIQCFAVCIHVCTCLSAYHIGLPGLLYIMRSNDDRDFPRFHNLHQMLPDPTTKDKRKTKQKKKHRLHNTQPVDQWSFPKLTAHMLHQKLPCFQPSDLVSDYVMILQQHPAGGIMLSKVDIYQE